LIAKTKELDEIRRSATWKKMLETGEYRDRTEDIVNEMEEDTDNFRVRSPYFVGMSRAATAEAGSPSDVLVTGS
jgi:hypothetical protein